MKKSYKIDVECANCAAKMEEAANKADGVNEATVNFMTQKIKVDFKDSADPQAVMADILKRCKKIESDCEIYF